MFVERIDSSVELDFFIKGDVDDNTSADDDVTAVVPVPLASLMARLD